MKKIYGSRSRNWLWGGMGSIVQTGHEEYGRRLNETLLHIHAEIVISYRLHGAIQSCPWLEGVAG